MHNPNSVDRTADLSQDDEKYSLVEKLAACKLLSDLTGELQPLQKVQLEYWPSFIAKNATKIDTRYNPFEKSISFYFTFSKTPPEPDFMHLFEILTLSIKDMLGEEWRTEFEINDLTHTVKKDKNVRSGQQRQSKSTPSSTSSLGNRGASGKKLSKPAKGRSSKRKGSRIKSRIDKSKTSKR